MRKPVKQALSALLLLALCLGLLPGTTWAAAQLEVTSVSGKRGDEVTVDIRLSGDNVYAGNFIVTYDHDALELLSAEKVGGWTGVINPSDSSGNVRLAMTSTSEKPIASGVVCTLTFRIKADAPVDGSPVNVKNAYFYAADGTTRVSAEVTAGTVSRQCVYYRMESVDTVEGQSARVEVSLDGALSPAGGGFTIAYDASVLKAVSVLTLGSLSQASVTYNLDTAGEVKIAFAGDKALENGRLCAVIFQAVGTAGTSAQLELQDPLAYDENSVAMDAAVTGGSVSIVTATEKNPKLWVVGGALEPDGTAQVGVVLQGRGQVCGGQFTLEYTGNGTIVSVQASDGVVVKQSQDGKKLSVAWGSATPALEEQTLVTLTISDGEENDALTFGSNVRLYDEENSIQVTDIRSGVLTGQQQIIPQVDEKASEVITTESSTQVTVTLDLADVGCLTEQKLESVTPVLALYENGRLKGLAMQAGVQMSEGVAEVSLSAKGSGDVTEYRLFVMDGGQSAAPLCQALDLFDLMNPSEQKGGKQP